MNIDPLFDAWCGTALEEDPSIVSKHANKIDAAIAKATGEAA